VLWVALGSYSVCKINVPGKSDRRRLGKAAERSETGSADSESIRKRLLAALAGALGFAVTLKGE